MVQALKQTASTLSQKQESKNIFHIWVQGFVSMSVNMKNVLIVDFFHNKAHTSFPFPVLFSV